MRKRLDVAVVGAGVSGLAAAMQLARAGHRVVVYERFADSRPVGSGLMMQPTGLAALDRLGLRAAIESTGHRIARLVGTTASGRSIFDVAYADLGPDIYAVSVHRAALHKVLWDAFSLSGAELVTGAPVTAVEQRADGRISPAVLGRPAGMAADLLIDASGARSVLRAEVTPGSAKPFAYGAVWANVPDLGLAPATLLQRYVAARVMVGHLPVGTGPGRPRQPMSALFWSLKPADYDRWCERFPEWQAEVVQLWPELAPLLAHAARVEDWTLASYAQFTAMRPWRRNVVLIGDAAHATSPQLGQGANNGLIDAVVLADMIEREPTIDRALACYAGHRRRHMRFYQLASQVMTPLFQSDSQLFPALRDLTFRHLRLIPWLRREMVRTLGGLKTGIFTSTSAAKLSAVEDVPLVAKRLIEAS